MPSGSRKAKRVIHWGPVLGLLLVINVLAALWFSPLFAIRIVRVVGAASHDEGRLREILAGLKGRPALRINPLSVESAAMDDPEVRTADFRRNLFGRATLRMEYRRAVARVLSEEPLGLSEDGVVFPTANLSADLPVVRLPSGLTPGLATAFGDWPSVEIAKIAVRASRLSPDASFGIELDAAGALCLNMGAGQVLLGSCEQLDGKLEKLEALLADQPELLSSVKSLNLMIPARPVFEPLAAADNPKETSP